MFDLQFLISAVKNQTTNLDTPIEHEHWSVHFMVLRCKRTHLFSLELVLIPARHVLTFCRAPV